MTLQSLLAEIESRMKAATPGPWDCDQCGDVWTKTITEFDSDIGMTVFRSIGTTPTAPNNPDAELIAHAPQDLTRLIQALKIADEALERIDTEQDMKPAKYVKEFARMTRTAITKILSGGEK